VTVPEESRDRVIGALGKLHTVASSAEFHDGFEPIYVDLGPALKFDSPDWEIIFGKPGAGKTMAMKAWEESVWTGVEAPAVLPVYVSGRDILDPPNASEEPHERAVAHFQLFLERFAHQLQRTAINARRKQSVVEKFLGDRATRAKQKRIEEKLGEIFYAVQTGQPLPRYEQLIYQQELTRDQEDRSSWGGRIQGSISEMGARIGVGGEASRESERSSQVRERITGTARMGPRYAEIRGYVAELARELEVERICILIDEWSMIDPVVQPGLAELLARSLWGSPQVTLKIAANRSKMQLIDPDNGHGFQIGRDIHPGMDLNQPQMSETALVDFYEELLFKRLSFLDYELEVFVVDRSGHPSPDFLETMFESRAAFEVLVKGTEGITRSFLSTMRRLAESSLPEGGWSVEDVQERVGPAEVPLAEGVQDTGVFEQLTEAELILEYVIRPVVVTTESRLLLVRPEDKRQARVPMSELARRGVIVTAFPDDLPEQLEDYDAYWLSEDQWRSFARAISYNQDPTIGDSGAAEELEPEEPRISTEDDAQIYLLDFSRYRA
jgi:hypothetical protein